MFELRRFDTKDEYTDELLKKRLNPPILLDIVKSNKFNPSKGCMEVDASYKVFSKEGLQLLSQAGDSQLQIKKPEQVINNESNLF